MKTAKELALMAARALSDKKGREIQVLEIGDLTTLADYFVIATGSSNTQINALVDNVERSSGRRRRRRPCTGRAIAAAPGCCWTTAASPSMSLTPRPGSFTAWSVCGATASPWTSPASWTDGREAGSPGPAKAVR